jgi:D-alanyl-D-alanine carboxypeptidase (penicillin-binding protein 5/6)
VAHVISRGQALARAALRYRSGQYVDLVAARTVSFVIPAGERYTVSLVGVPRQVSGPLTAGAPEGSAVIRTGARIVGQVPVVTARAVSAATLGQRLGDYFSRAVTLALLGGLVVCSLLLVVLRRRANRRREARVDRRAGTEVA